MGPGEVRPIHVLRTFARPCFSGARTRAKTFEGSAASSVSVSEFVRILKACEWCRQRERMERERMERG
jgi:hypothetical protein